MILKRLREETSRNHSAVELQLPVLDPSMSLGTYRDLLSRFWGYYAPLEQRLQNEIAIYWPKKGRDLIKQTRKQLLELARPMLESLVHEASGVKVRSMHHDISLVRLPAKR